MRESIEISIDLIKPNQNQPREDFNHEGLMELAQSIRENGVIQPIVVREVGEGYEIIAGERRFRANILAGNTTIPAIVKEATELQSAEMALVENIQRQGLSAIEEAKALKTLMDHSQMTQEDLANKIGKSQSAIANKMRLLNLPDEIQEAVASRFITERHARALLGLTPEQQLDVFDKIRTKKWNVARTEKYIEEIANSEPEEEKPKIKRRAFSKDQRLGINTIMQAVKQMQEMGIEVIVEQKDGDEGIEILVRFPK